MKIPLEGAVRVLKMCGYECDELIDRGLSEPSGEITLSMQEKIVAQQAKIDALVIAVADHVTVRSELRGQVVAQQARIEQLRNAVSLPCGRWNATQHKIVSKALEYKDDLSVLREHDAAIWREAAKVCGRIGEFLHGQARDDSEAFDCFDALNDRADAIEKGGA